MRCNKNDTHTRPSSAGSKADSTSRVYFTAAKVDVCDEIDPKVASHVFAVSA
jgi:hypothetical protein